MTKLFNCYNTKIIGIWKDERSVIKLLNCYNTKIVVFRKMECDGIIELLQYRNGLLKKLFRT